MADDHRGRLAQDLHQPDHVADSLAHVVGLDGGGTVGHTKTALVRCDHSEARGYQGRDLSSPHVPEVRETMQKDDQGSLTFFDVVHADAVDVGETVVERTGIVGLHLP
ncbi:hypothetical protein D3C85_1077790 [compost metagenome]